jgi:hypothetical protein
MPSSNPSGVTLTARKVALNARLDFLKIVGLALLEFRIPLRVSHEQQPLPLPCNEQDHAGVVRDLA